ncbi:MAG: hypothetical protein RLZZ15_4364 [Verrucomicrobiota bacterium]|jgi:uncharacterized membrane protein YgdD (TMEM256/DUF423 family)
MNRAHRFPLIAAGLLGLTGVALGAFGAHGLDATLAERGTKHAWETAARYQLLHTVALLGAAVWLRTTATARAHLTWAARGWTAGTVIFSGSLYALALGGPRWLGPITPLGGLALLGGWACVLAAAWAREE